MAQRTVLVTGGAKGVGLIMSRALALAGWSVSACGRTEMPPTASIRYVAADLALPGAAANLLQRVGPTLPDALVCNAGDYGALGRFLDVGKRAWRASLELNFFSVVELVYEYLLRVELEQRNGASIRARKIVILGGGGIGGSHVAPRMLAYHTAKGALVRFAEALAVEVRAMSVDVNVLLPGAIETGITEQARAAGLLVTAPNEKEDAVKRAKLERVIVRLLSPELDGVTGRLIAAQWDEGWLEAPAELIRNMDLLTLRRIDNDTFR